MVFGLLRWVDGQMTDHMTVFLHKQFIQFDVPSIGTSVGCSDLIFALMSPLLGAKLCGIYGITGIVYILSIYKCHVYI